MTKPKYASPPQCSLGIAGLDEILLGGLPADRFYLIQGDPGAGKTTLALQFLLEGARKGEKGLYITLSETRDELLAVAESHGWSLDPLDIIELSAVEDRIVRDSQNTLFHPVEVELAETVDLLLKEVERINPARVVFDSLSEIRLLAQDSLRYRRQMLSFKQHFARRKSTVLLLDDKTTGESDLHVQSIAHGVISLLRMNTRIGSDRRQIHVVKLRGARYLDGFHDYDIRTGGLQVYPRMSPSASPAPTPEGTASSGLRELDDLLGGGLDRGTSTILVGPAGAGKSSIAAQFATAAAARGEKCALFVFDENLHTFIKRTEALGMAMRNHIASGMIKMRHVDAAAIAPGEMADSLRRSVEEDGVRLVLIDSLNGYLQAMPEERFLTLQLHEILSYLNQQGVVSLLLMAQHGVVGEVRAPVDLTYIADTVLLLRFYEKEGALRKAISVVKKRSGPHEETIRELTLAGGRLRIGPVLKDCQGAARGLPDHKAGKRTDRDAQLESAKA
jgi:circadian clock protein KaiC